MICDQQAANQVADVFKALGYPLRIQIVMIVTNKRMVSIPTLQDYLPGVDPFVLYSNLRLMHKKHLIKKLRKGREVYYSLSDTAIRMGIDAFFQAQADRLRVDDTAGRIRECSVPNERLIFA